MTVAGGCGSVLGGAASFFDALIAPRQCWGWQRAAPRRPVGVVDQEIKILVAAWNDEVRAAVPDTAVGVEVARDVLDWARHSLAALAANTVKLVRGDRIDVLPTVLSSSNERAQKGIRTYGFSTNDIARMRLIVKAEQKAGNAPEPAQPKGRTWNAPAGNNRLQQTVQPLWRPRESPVKDRTHNHPTRLDERAPRQDRALRTCEDADMRLTSARRNERDLRCVTCRDRPCRQRRLQPSRWRSRQGRTSRSTRSPRLTRRRAPAGVTGQRGSCTRPRRWRPQCRVSESCGKGYAETGPGQKAGVRAERAQSVPLMPGQAAGMAHRTH